MLAPDIQRVISRATPRLTKRLPGVLIGALADLCVVALLALSMWLIVRSGEQPPILFLTFAIVGVRALAIGRAAFRYAERLASHDAAFQQLATLRTETFAQLVPRVPGVLDTHRRGDVLTGFVDDVDQLQDEPLRVRQPLLVSLLITALALVTMAAVSPLAAAIMGVSLFGFGALGAWLAVRIAAATDRRLAEARAELADALLERVAAAEVLQAFAAVNVSRRRISDAETRMANVQKQAVRAEGLIAALVSLGAGLATVLTLIAVAPQLGVSLTAPLFATLVIVPAAVGEVFVQAPTALLARRKVIASAERVAALTETPIPAEIPQDTATVGGGGSTPERDHAAARDTDAAAVQSAGSLQLTDPVIELRGLAVTHPGQPRPAVSDINLAVSRGTVCVISGASGTGKSTLALALVRMLDYTGSYRLAGTEAKHLSIETVRQTVGLCEQTPHLFDADLRQNLKFAKPEADDSELMAALDRVGLGEWARARGGLDARLGQRGALVSGGQAQRIALARALLADFPVVVLDEPTAGVDRPLADQLMRDLVGAVPKDRAVILITHTDLPPGIPAEYVRLPEQSRLDPQHSERAQ